MNEIPTLLGNIVGGITFVGLTMYATHHHTRPPRIAPAEPVASPEPVHSST